MTGPSHPDLLSRTHGFPTKSALEAIKDFANINVQTLANAAAIVSAVEATMAARAGIAMSVATKVSIWLLPIAAFQFGTFLREQHDDEKGKEFFHTARRIIIGLAIAHAIDLHLQKHPKSKLRDDSMPMGIRIAGHLNLGEHISQVWTQTYKAWDSRLKSQLDQVRKTRGMPFASYLLILALKEGWEGKYGSKNSEPTSLWRAYVMSRFESIRRDFTQLLTSLEAQNK